ncbi:MAG: 50S ribosomal protein L35ae [Candidatus Nanoarchaeia archaeon]
MVKGKVIQFRRSKSRQKPRHFLIEIEGVDDRQKASKLAGKEVIWTSPAKKVLKGKVSTAHGNKGLVRVIFETGLPGQAIGEEVELK